jgi:hypothetical protein
VTNRVIDFIGVSSRVGSDAQHDNSVQCFLITLFPSGAAAQDTTPL